MREAIARDRNHPAIFAWVAFNETWGLGHPEAYKADRDTQEWVKLDGRRRSASSTRPAWSRTTPPATTTTSRIPTSIAGTSTSTTTAKAREHIAEVVAKTEPGSAFNYCPGEVQTTAPLINSEYGGVSAGGGDRDVSWGFRDLTTQLRRHSKIQGYVYTELADIEWEHNGFVNYDRTPKEFGYDAFVPGMTVSELQGADFIGYDAPPVIVARPGETITVPLFVSHFSDRKGPAKLRWWVVGSRRQGRPRHGGRARIATDRVDPYDVRQLEPVKVRMPMRPFVGAIAVDACATRTTGGSRPTTSTSSSGPSGPLPRVERGGDREVVLRFAPGDVRPEPVDGPRGEPRGRRRTARARDSSSIA